MALWRRGSALSPAARAFTLVELLVVIGIIALLISVLLPALNKAREAGTRVACASNMRQVGTAIAMYLSENRGTYPPAWFPDNPSDPSNNIYSGTARNASFVTVLGKYIGSRTKDDLYQGTDNNLFKCPNDKLERASWLQGGTLSYLMPVSWGPDRIFYGQRWLGGGVKVGPVTTSGDPPATRGQTLNRGIGQLWDGANKRYPMWIKASMVKPASKALLLVERSYSEGAQTTKWNLGYQVSSPANQLWSRGGVYGFPMLHSRKGGENMAYFNYLFCDYHVELLSPRDTVRDESTLLPSNGWLGGDYMWTIRPEEYDNKF